MKSISIVVPLYNEAGNIVRLHTAINKVCMNMEREYEIIFVDDGSTDNTARIAKELSPLIFIKLRRNFGQTAAMDAGIKRASNNYIITLDGDLQNDPDDFPRLIEYLEVNNLDVVSGWRINRKDTFMKHLVSRGANKLRKLILNDGIHDSGCSLKIYKQECFKELSLYGEMHRFIPALLKMKGFKIGEIFVNHEPRTAGKSKYNWKRTLKGFTDMLLLSFWGRYSVRPIHLLGGTGIFLIFLGIITATATIMHFFKGQGMSETAFPLLTVFLFFTGFQLFIFGVIADILLKSYYETTYNSPYQVEYMHYNKKGLNMKVGHPNKSRFNITQKNKIPEFLV